MSHCILETYRLRIVAIAHGQNAEWVSEEGFLARMERFGLGGKTILYSSKAQECEAGLPLAR